MTVDVVEKLVHVKDGSIVGYNVSAGGAYKVSVTQKFGASHGVEDMDIAQYLNVPQTVVVPVGEDKFGLVEHSSGFFEELADSPMGYFGDRKVYFGYLFSENCIVSLDSEAAFNRMIAERRGTYADV